MVRPPLNATVIRNVKYLFQHRHFLLLNKIGLIQHHNLLRRAFWQRSQLFPAFTQILFKLILRLAVSRYSLIFAQGNWTSLLEFPFKLLSQFTPDCVLSFLRSLLECPEGYLFLSLRSYSIISLLSIIFAMASSRSTLNASHFAM